jgi:accessory gene regulator protein AgrB
MKAKKERKNKYRENRGIVLFTIIASVVITAFVSLILGVLLAIFAVVLNYLSKRNDKQEDIAAKLGYISGAIGLLFYPIVFGTMAIGLGFLGLRSKEKGMHAKIAIIIGSIDLVLAVALTLLLS